MSECGYDFSRCKLCGEKAAAPAYDLQETIVQACRRCDFHFITYLDPPSRDGEGGGELDEKAWRYIEERLSCDDRLLDARIDFIKRFGGICGSECLDVGAGVGQFMMRLSQEGARSSEGIEPSRKRREFARRRFDLELCEATVESPCWQENCRERFDLITLWDVIEHVNFPLETVRCAGHLLKPGGLLFIDTPSREVPSYRISQWFYRLTGSRFPLFLLNFYSSLPYGHKQIFRPDHLMNLVESAGFEVLARRGDYRDRPAGSAHDGRRIVLACRKRSV